MRDEIVEHELAAPWDGSSPSRSARPVLVSWCCPDSSGRIQRERCLFRTFRGDRGLDPVVRRPRAAAWHL